MNVLLANGVCRFGGVTTFLHSLRSALQKAGHHCELFFFQRGPGERLIPASEGVHFGDLGDLLMLVDRGRFEIVHTNNVDWPLGVSAARHLGARLVVTAHKVRPDERAYGGRTGRATPLPLSADGSETTFNRIQRCLSRWCQMGSTSSNSRRSNGT